MTWTDTQITLISALAAYESADRASKICGDMIEGQWRKADALHDELLKAALACDFQPGGYHAGMSTVDFANRMAAAFSRLLSPYVTEAELFHTLAKKAAKQ